MKGVRKIERLDPDGHILVSLSEEVDLDELLLHLAAEGYEQPDYDEAEDEPTAITRRHEWWSDELEVGRYRNIPCFCGEGHTYDVRAVSEGANQRGSYLGVMTR